MRPTVNVVEFCRRDPLKHGRGCGMHFTSASLVSRLSAPSCDLSAKSYSIAEVKGAKLMRPDRLSAVHRGERVCGRVFHTWTPRLSSCIDKRQYASTGYTGPQRMFNGRKLCFASVNKLTGRVHSRFQQSSCSSHPEICRSRKGIHGPGPHRGHDLLFDHDPRF